MIDRFKRYVESWIDDGLVQVWDGRIVVVEKGVVKAEKTGDNRYVAVPGMSSIGKHLAADLRIQLGTQVATPTRLDDQWLLATEDGVELGQFDVVTMAVPSHQAAPLLTEARGLADQAGGVKMNGCWALMLAFEGSLNLGYDGAFVHGSPLSWIARNSSKTGRGGKRETWVVHAAAEWTEAHIDESPAEITPRLIEAFRSAVGNARQEPIHCAAHRWRFAIPQQPLNTTCLFDDELMIGACGDWCGGPRVEGAFLSGMALAGRILGRLNSTFAAAPAKGRQLALF